MIWYYILLFVTSVLNAAFNWLGVVTTLPTILGVDVDAALNTIFGTFFAITDVFWPAQDIYLAAVYLFGYYVIRNIVLRLLLGHRLS